MIVGTEAVSRRRMGEATSSGQQRLPRRSQQQPWSSSAAAVEREASGWIPREGYREPLLVLEGGRPAGGLAIVDGVRRELRVSIADESDPPRFVTEHVAVRRLVGRPNATVPPPRVHIIVHLTDIAVPDPGRKARAVVQVLE